MVLKEMELVKINGGGFLMTSTYLNSLARIVSTIMDLGRTVGSSIRRAYSKNYC